MVGRVERICQVCGSSVGFTRSDDGFFYCGYCNSQADDIFDTGVDEEQFFSHYSASCNRVRPANAIAAEPISQVKLTTSQYLDHPDILVEDMEDDDMGDGVGPSGPSDFGSSQKNFSYEDYYSEIRSRYLTGLQVMIQLQCQALVEKFNVSPLIIGLVGTLWLREAEEFKPSAKFRSEPVNIHGKLWEGVTPSDMLKWTLEGKIPYFAAFGVIEKQLGSHSEACPIRASRMFRPIQAISSQKLEAMAADIAQKISLELPPVNFYAIAFRYCRQLALPVREILPQACRICEWSMPSELYLSANEFRIPTRVCVMSILIVAIRIIFDINGYGMWESSLSNSSCSLSRVKNKETESQSSPNTMENADDDSSSNNSQSSGTKSGVEDSKFSVVELLQILEGKYNELDDVHGSGTSDHQGDAQQSRPHEVEKTRSSDQNSASCTQSPDEDPKDKAITQLKLDMEENKFCYIPPRIKVKRKDYLHYARRRKDVYIYAVHADYYILLRCCAKAAQVEPRIMHIAVLGLERRLHWLEKRMDASLKLKLNLNGVCDFCKDEFLQNGGNDPMDLKT
ncbi:UNVERIFIED_CONTAM: TATA box-binding protein-associated factor RNA polymerase I subunit B [Sesamum angustifolium]|uniref:TATA box-binding protein-associated factor RNA polymerase I subunit B n=1 Tax=Sesamum angustifolium TaxID=2727405 RepID=A0AAW2LIN0_9LAMI